MDFSKLFPENANNNYVGHKIALWGFILFTCVMTWRSIVHMFFEQYGFHEIANFGLISGDLDPMPLIYRFFSLWGFAQLDRKSTRLNSSHVRTSRMPSSA